MPTYKPSQNVTAGSTVAGGDKDTSSHQVTGSLVVTGSLFINGVQITTDGGGGGGGISWDGSTANGVATFKDADEATVEANLTFDGTDLKVFGAGGVSVGNNAAPDALLHVSSSGDLKLFQVDGATAGTVLQVSGAAATFSGSVGVNTTAPVVSQVGSALDVVTTATGSIRILNDSSKGFVIGHAAASWPANHVGIGAQGMPAGSYALTVAQDSGHTYLSTWDGNTVYINGGGGNTGNSIAVHDYDSTQRLELKSTNVFVSDGAYGAGATAGVQCQVSSSGNEALLQVDGATAGSVLFVTGSGRVGIGTTSPGKELTVVGEISASAALYGTDLVLRTSATDNIASIYIEGTSGTEIIGQAGGDMNIRCDGGDLRLLGGTGNELHFGTNNIDSKAVMDTAGNLGIGTSSPKTALDVHYTGSVDPTSLSTNTGGGEVVFYGTGSNLQSGSIVYLNTDGGWDDAMAEQTGSGHNQLLGIPLGPNPVANGVLLRGYYSVHSDQYAGAFIKGGPVYINSGSLAGGGSAYMSGAAPTDNEAYVRIVGYGTNTANVIYFNPDSTYVEIEVDDE